MSLLLPQTISVNFDGIDRNIYFNIRVVHIIQDHFDMHIGDVIKMLISQEPEDLRNAYKNSCYVLKVIFNEDTRIYNKTHTDKREDITVEYLEDILTHATMNKLMNFVYQSFSETLPEKSEEDTDPNPKSE